MKNEFNFVNIFNCKTRIKMPLQKNSNNKKARKQTGADRKNRSFISDFLSDIKAGEDLKDIHVGKVAKKLGDGRIEVFYVKQKENGDTESHTVQVRIPGTFRGRGKHSVWIETGSPVIISIDESIDGTELLAVLKRDQLEDIAEEIFVDNRILNNTDREEDESGIVFDTGDDPEKEHATKPKSSWKADRDKKEEKELSDRDIDNI